MKPRTLILLIMAVGCGLVAALLVSQVAGKGQVDNKIEVPLAKIELRQGYYIKDPELVFEKKPVNKESVPPNTIMNIQDLKGKSLQRSIDAGTWCTKRDLGDSDGIARNLPDGHRAQTIRVTADSAVSGFIMPGSHVDLICMMPDPKDPRQTMARTFMQNKLVLAVNAEDVRPEGAKVMNAPAFVTLALTPKEVEQVTRATRDGIPVMTMRKPGDVLHAKTDGAATPFGRGTSDSDAGPENRDVLFTKKSIEPGTKITDADEFFEVKKIPTDMVPPDAITDKASVQGETVQKYLGQRLPLTRAYLGTSGVENPAVAVAPKSYKLKIWNGANLHEHQFEHGQSTSREGLPPPVVTPPPPGKEGGSEGK